MQGGVCQPGNAFEACGIAGEACASCTTTDVCQTSSSCLGQECVFVLVDEGVACPFVDGNPSSGVCIGGTCQEAGEDCLNGVDDSDDDTLVDCNDDDCDVSFACVDTTPSGWIGPVALYLADVPCPGTWATEVDGPSGIGVVADPYTCTCACTVPVCDEVTFEYGTSSAPSCTDATTEVRTLQAGACDSLGESTTSSVARNLTPTCAATTDEEFELPTAAFATAVTVCASDLDPGGGCDGGSCRLRAPLVGAEEGLVCIYQAGAMLNCPTGFSTRVAKVATSFADTRGCGCACTESSCGADIEFFDNVECTECGENPGSCGALTADDECLVDIPAATELFATWVPRRGSVPTCEAEGSPTGDLATSGELTFCCITAD